MEASEPWVLCICPCHSGSTRTAVFLDPDANHYSHLTASYPAGGGYVPLPTRAQVSCAPADRARAAEYDSACVRGAVRKTRRNDAGPRMSPTARCVAARRGVGAAEGFGLEEASVHPLASRQPSCRVSI